MEIILLQIYEHLAVNKSLIGFTANDKAISILQLCLIASLNLPGDIILLIRDYFPKYNVIDYIISTYECPFHMIRKIVPRSGDKKKDKEISSKRIKDSFCSFGRKQFLIFTYYLDNDFKNIQDPVFIQDPIFFKKSYYPTDKNGNLHIFRSNNFINVNYLISYYYILKILSKNLFTNEISHILSNNILFDKIDIKLDWINTFKIGYFNNEYFESYYNMIQNISDNKLPSFRKKEGKKNYVMTPQLEYVLET
jgi:hypothetical protein